MKNGRLQNLKNLIAQNKAIFILFCVALLILIAALTTNIILKAKQNQLEARQRENQELERELENLDAENTSFNTNKLIEFYKNNISCGL